MFIHFGMLKYIKFNHTNTIESKFSTRHTKVLNKLPDFNREW